MALSRHTRASVWGGSSGLPPSRNVLAPRRPSRAIREGDPLTGVTAVGTTRDLVVLRHYHLFDHRLMQDKAIMPRVDLRTERQLGRRRHAPRAVLVERRNLLAALCDEAPCYAH